MYKYTWTEVRKIVAKLKNLKDEVVRYKNREKNPHYWITQCRREILQIRKHSVILNKNLDRVQKLLKDDKDKPA